MALGATTSTTDTEDSPELSTTTTITSDVHHWSGTRYGDVSVRKKKQNTAIKHVHMGFCVFCLSLFCGVGLEARKKGKSTN